MTIEKEVFKIYALRLLCVTILCFSDNYSIENYPRGRRNTRDVDPVLNLLLKA